MCYCLNSMDSESWKYQMFKKKEVKPDEVTLGYNYREQDTENWPPNALFFFFWWGVAKSENDQWKRGWDRCGEGGVEVRQKQKTWNENKKLYTNHRLISKLIWTNLSKTIPFVYPVIPI